MNILLEIKLAFSENKKILLLASLIFFIPLFIGFIFKPYFYSIFNPMVESVTRQIKEGTIIFGFKDIFTNNIFIVLKCYIFGIICIFSAFLLAYNGFFVGYFISGGNILRKLVLMLPHGIFEFASLIIATTAGFLLFKFIIKFLSFNGFYKTFDENFNILKQSFILLAISSILMIIAGIIEVYITIPLSYFIFSLT